jgi:hypothetical protein
MQIHVRRQFTLVEEQFQAAGRKAAAPLRRVAAITIVENPLVGRYEQDLSDLIASSEDLGCRMAALAVSAFGPHEVQSYGKGGIVGHAGEQEHANALITTTFANPFRDAIGGAAAWISSVTKCGAPGTLIDVPMNHKDDVYVRSHYDAMSLCVPGAPAPDEIVIIFCLASGGRLNARVGGLTHEEVRDRLAAVSQSMRRAR